MICPKCGAEIREQSRFCRQCGTPLGSASGQPGAEPLQNTRCPSCGHEVPAGKRFCGACGDMVGTQESDPWPAAAGPFIAESKRPEKPFPRAALAVLVVVVVLLVGAGTWYALGVDLVIATSPGGAQALVDGKVVGTTSMRAGHLAIPHLKHGTHRITLLRPGFAPWSHTVWLGAFELSHPLHVKLPLPSYRLLVVTNPAGASVNLDGDIVGTSDASGRLVIPNVTRGVHTVIASADGYPSSTRRFYVAAPSSVRLDLAALAAQARQQEATLLAQARMLYRQGRFRTAIGDCNALLSHDPKNQAAAHLKEQIEKTEAILGGK